jgi:hypothetical protein
MQHASAPVCSSKQHVDLNTAGLLQDLTWDDREKVLRLLFAKLNDPRQQPLLDRLPGHIPLKE